VPLSILFILFLGIFILAFNASNTQQTRSEALQLPKGNPDFNPNPLDTQVFVSVKFQGVDPQSTTPKHLSRKIQVNIFSLKNEPVLSGSGFIKYETDGSYKGVIHLGTLANDTYYVKTVGEHTLEALIHPDFQSLSNNQLNILPEVRLIQGDLDTDNAITIDDFNIALACFRDKKCESKNLIDFNDDGNSDVIDYNLFLSNFWRREGD